MPVHYPKGAEPTSSPGMSPAVPAPAKAPGKQSKGGDHHHHHAQVGAALKKGDIKGAMQHTGRMMLAMRSHQKATAATGVMVPQGASDVIGSDTMASGDDVGATPTLPAKKSFNRKAFGAMKAKGGLHSTLQNPGV